MANPGLNVQVWQSLMAEEAASLRADAAKAEHPSVADMVRLRKLGSAEMVAAAFDLAKARRKAVFKFPERAQTLVADPAGVEMASSLVAGSWKARRFVQAFGGGRVLDLCCGIGGDAIALAGAGLDVLAVDLDAARGWMTGLNAGCGVEIGDAVEVAERLRLPFHLDPARRDGSGVRAWTLDELVPNVDAIARIIAAGEHGGVKLSPGIHFGEVAQRLGVGEVEILSEHGRLTQAVLWCGKLSRGEGLRTATMLGSGLADGLTMTGVADGELPMAEIGAFLAEPDDSIERAELLGTLCAETGAEMIHPKLGLLTAAEPIVSPWCSGFRTLEVFAWNERRAKDILKRHHAGVVEVKTRAKAVNPDELQPKLSTKEGEPTVLFVFRFNREVRGIVARRIVNGV